MGFRNLVLVVLCLTIAGLATIGLLTVMPKGHTDTPVRTTMFSTADEHHVRIWGRDGLGIYTIRYCLTPHPPITHPLIYFVLFTGRVSLDTTATSRILEESIHIGTRYVRAGCHQFRGTIAVPRIPGDYSFSGLWSRNWGIYRVWDDEAALLYRWDVVFRVTAPHGQITMVPPSP